MPDRQNSPQKTPPKAHNAHKDHNAPTIKQDQKKDDAYFMAKALKEAQKAAKKGDVPVGAVLVLDGKIIARSHNQKEQKQDPLAHAESLVLQKAAKKIGSWRLLDTTLYCTLEPCPLCAGAMLQSRITRLVYGAPDLRWGVVETMHTLLDDNRWNHHIKITKGILRQESETLLRTFFQTVRKRH